MLKKIFKFIPIAILIAIPSLIAFYNDLEVRIDCESQRYQDHPRCVAAKNEEFRNLSNQKILETEKSIKNGEKPELVISNSIAEIDSLKQQIYKQELENLDETNKNNLLQKTDKYNQLVLNLLNELSEESQVKVCENNGNFVPTNQIEAEIKEICDRVLKVDGKAVVEGINSQKEIKLFEINLANL